MYYYSEKTKDLIDRMKKADKTASCTYFPMEGKYLTFINSGVDAIGPPKILTGIFHENKYAALIEAIEILE
jgi:hypothetical protein